MKRLALIGSKDFADQIQSYVESKGMYSVVGFFDDFVEKGTIIRNHPVLGKISEIEKCYKDNLFDYVFFAAGYNNFNFRDNIFTNLKSKVPFANLIDDSVVIGKNVTLGEGIYIGPNSSIGDNTVVNDNVFIHGSTNIGHDNKVGSHTYFSGRIDTAGFCEIGERCFFGIRALCADHITICDDVWIGIGCVVAKDIKQSGKYMSSAAKLYKID